MGEIITAIVLEKTLPAFAYDLPPCCWTQWGSIWDLNLVLGMIDFVFYKLWKTGVLVSRSLETWLLYAVNRYGT